MNKPRNENHSLLSRANKLGSITAHFSHPEREKPIRLFLEVLLVVFLSQAVILALLYALSTKSIIDIVLHSVLLGLITVAVLYRLIVCPLKRAFSKREQVEQLLQAGEQIYRTLYKSSSDAIILASREKGFIAANPAAVKLFRCETEEQLTSKTLADFTPQHQPDGTASVEKAEQMAKIAAEKSAHSFQFRYKRTDGTEFPAEVMLTVTEMNNQTILQSIVRDATEKTLLESNLKEHVRQLDCLYGLSKLVDRPDVPLSEIFQQVTSLAHDTYQHPEQTCVRIIFDGVQYKTDNFTRTELSQHASIDIGTEQVGTIEVYYLGDRGRDGENPLLKEEHDLLNTIAKRLGLIAERKRTADKLQLFRNLIDRSNDFTFVVEPEWGRFLDVNDRACDTLGYTRDELLNMTLADIDETIHDHDQWVELVADIRKKTNAILEGVHKHRNGTTFPVEINVKFIKQENKSYLLAVARDITERKKAEEKQAQLLNEVESANKELKDFAYIISHDLKAPLRGIKSLTEWLGADYADKLDDEGKEQMDLLASRVGRMHNLIDGVLQYSRVGRISEEHTSINLNELVPEVIDMVSAPDNIQITIRNELPTIVSERTRISQVFQNLLSNAVKYMDKPRGLINIACIAEDDSWKFSVSDNGPGIEEQHFEKIFKIFQTLQARDQFESTGVGLTLVKKIVEMYDGRVWVESKVGEGTTFFFTLPKQRVSLAEQTLEAVAVTNTG